MFATDVGFFIFRLFSPPLKITTRHLKAAILLAAGEKSTSEIAGEIGRSPRRLREWLRDADFLSLVRGLQDEIVKAALRHQRGHVLEAAHQVTNIMRQGVAADATKLDAAQDILDRVQGKGVQPIEHRDGPKVINVPE